MLGTQSNLASSTRAINRMPRKLSRDLCGDGIRFSGAITCLTKLAYLQVNLSNGCRYGCLWRPIEAFIMLIIWVCRVWDVWEEKKPVKIEIDCIYGFLCCPICSPFGFGIYGT